MEKIIKELESNQDFINKIILSDTKSDTKKIIVTPKNMKSGILWQIERFIGTKVFHENVEFHKLFDLNFNDYRQITIEKVGETCIFSKSNSTYKCKRKVNEQKRVVLQHNRDKSYILQEGENIPALIDLGVFTNDYKLVKSMQDKFKQINKFIEIIDDAFKSSNMKELTILDFGCGKSYLTFLVYYYFVKIKNIKAHIIGYDIKPDVIENCNKIAKKYGYDSLEFVLSDVSKDKLYDGKIDMIISLHACDTATDYALNFAIKNNVKFIFSVPCCQHEVNLSICSGGDFDILLDDGLIKERFSALLTDSVRVQILRACGYSVDVIEFVDFEASPKNLMIRACKNSNKKSIDKVEKLIDKYKFNQTLYNLQINKKC